MKATFITFAAALGLASAQKAIVTNGCSSTFYVQSFPFDGSAPGPLTTVEAGKFFSESLRPSGSTVKISKTKTLDTPLFFGYSFGSNPDYAYYELSTEWGNPFADSHNSLGAGEGCNSFDCEAGDAGCYSTPEDKKDYSCPEPVDLTASICL